MALSKEEMEKKVLAILETHSKMVFTMKEQVEDLIEEVKGMPEGHSRDTLRG